MMLFVLQVIVWFNVLLLTSSSSIIRYTNKSSTPDNLDDDSVTLEHNNHSVVIELPKNSKFLIKDSANNILFSKNPTSFQNPHYTCNKSAICEPLINHTCLGIKLPYNFTTTTGLISDLLDQQDAWDRLKRWQGLRNIPKCWSAIQSFLCALYVPKCDNDSIAISSLEVCKVISGPCRIVANELGAEFNCNGSKISRSCRHEGRELKSNSTGQCKAPLVATESVGSFYPGVEGCGVQCYDPMYSKDEHETIENTIFILAISCCLLIVLSIMTLIMINWEATSVYFTSKVILSINVCFCIASLGWLFQFIPGMKDSIVCQRDGTLRVSGPRFDFCTGTFIVIYWSVIAGLVWFVILTYILYITFQEKTGKIHDRIRKKVPWFHIAAWAGVPLPLIIVICWIGEIDGNSASGICFVGYNNHMHRLLFFWAPVICSFIVADTFLIKGLMILHRLKYSSQEVMSEEDAQKVKYVFNRILVFTVLVNIMSMFTSHYLFYELGHADLWKSSLREFIVCGFGVNSDTESCQLENKPNVAYLEFHYFAMFSTAIVITTYWVFFTEHFLQSWCNFLKLLIQKEIEDPEIEDKDIAAKHKLVRRGYAKSKKTNNVHSRISVYLYDTPQDPMGINFELNSKASHCVSASWAAALPNFIIRRNALKPVATDSNSSYSSSKSEISYSVCRVSVESRRNSNDSSVSVQAVEVTKTVRKSRGDRRGSRKKRRDVRSSSTSQESFFRWTQVLASSTVPDSNSSTKEPNLGRRTAIAGMNDSMLKLTQQLFSKLESDENDEEDTSKNGIVELNSSGSESED